MGAEDGEKKGKSEEVDSSVWEEQLQQELQDLELQVGPWTVANFNPYPTVQGVSGEGEGEGGGEEVDTEAWEAELQEMLDMHSQEPTTQN